MSDDPKILRGHVGYSPDYKATAPGPYSGTRAHPLDQLLASGRVTSAVVPVDESAREPSTLRRQVTEFHRAYGQPIVTTPAVPSDARVTLRARLVGEEFHELMEALYACPSNNARLAALKRAIDDLVSNGCVSVDLIEAADATADLDYVVEGTRIEFGIDGGPIADEVHRSNLSKLGADGQPVKNEFGKIVKGPHFSPPDIAGELRKQGWTP